MGFNKDFTCRGFKYEVGGEYENIDNMKFFFYENPLNVLKYKGLVGCRYAVVISSGEVARNYRIAAAQRIRIEKEISLLELINDGVKYAVDAANENMDSHSLVMNSGHGSIFANYRDWSLAVNIDSYSIAVNEGRHSMAVSRGNESVAVNRGDSSAAITEGHCSVAVCTSEFSTAIVEGEGSIAIAIGYGAMAKACIGSEIVLADWQKQKDEMHPVDVKSFYVDGVIVKADTFYRCKDGKLIEAE